MLFKEETHQKAVENFERVGLEDGALKVVEDYMNDKIDAKALRESIRGVLSSSNSYDFHRVFYHADRDEYFYKSVYVAYVILGDGFTKSWYSRSLVHDAEDVKEISDNTDIPAWELVDVFLTYTIPTRYDAEEYFVKLKKAYSMYKDEFRKVIKDGSSLESKALAAFIAVLEDFKGKEQNEIDNIYLDVIKEYICKDVAKAALDTQGKAVADLVEKYIATGEGDIAGVRPISNGHRVVEFPVLISVMLEGIDFCERTIKVVMYSLGSMIIEEINRSLNIKAGKSVYRSNLSADIINYYGKDPVYMRRFIYWLISRNISEREPDSISLKMIYKTYRDNFMEFFENTGDLEKIYMLIAMGDDRDMAEHAEFIRDYGKKELDLLMGYTDMDDKSKNIMMDYMDGKVKFEKLKMPKKNSYSKYDRSILDVILGYLKDAWKDHKEEYSRYINVVAFININNIGMIQYATEGLGAMVSSKSDFTRVKELFRFCEMDEKIQAAYISTLFSHRHSGGEHKQLHDMINEKTDDVFKGYEMCLGEVKEDLLEEIREFMNKEKDEKKQDKYKEFLFQCMNESGKAVKGEVVESIQESGFTKELILRALEDSKVNRRMIAVDISEECQDDDIKKALMEVLDKEKSAKVKNRIQEIMGVASEEEEEAAALDSSKGLEEYCLKNTSKNKLSKIKWIDRDDMGSINFKDGGEISDAVYKYLMVTYSDTDGIKLNPEGEKVASFINEKDLKEMAWVVLNQWLNSGAEAKKKWVLIFSTVYGDHRVVELLKKKIKEWPEMSRGTMATYAIKALALNGSDEVLLFLDGISRKFKFKQIKKAASEALEIAASELNIHPEELSDRLIPTLGFENGSERVFDYGERKFMVSLGSDLSLSVKNEDGKKLKNLPAVGKKDDQEQAKQSKEEFKLLKKSLKNVVSIQRERLELALSTNRMWTMEKWEKVFVQNDIMHMFAVGLVWGIYKDGNMVESFRYMEDGTFNTFDEDELQVEKYRGSQEYMVGLAHPVELEEDAIEGWREQFEDYEIEQPFPQLHRKIFSVEENEKKQFYVDKFAGYEMNGLSLLGKITKLGWYKGSILDAGGYYTFYKEIGDIGVQLYMSGMYVGMGAYDAEDVMIFEYAFYKAGSFDRGSYVYDDITKEIVVNPGDVPARVYSEVANDIMKITEKCEERDENWKKNENYGYHGFNLKDK